MFLSGTIKYEFENKHEKYSLEPFVLDILILYSQSMLIIKIGHFRDLASYDYI